MDSIYLWSLVFFWIQREKDCGQGVVRLEVEKKWYSSSSSSSNGAAQRERRRYKTATATDNNSYSNKYSPGLGLGLKSYSPPDEYTCSNVERSRCSRAALVLARRFAVASRRRALDGAAEAAADETPPAPVAAPDAAAAAAAADADPLDRMTARRLCPGERVKKSR